MARRADERSGAALGMSTVRGSGDGQLDWWCLGLVGCRCCDRWGLAGRADAESIVCVRESMRKDRRPRVVKGQVARERESGASMQTRACEVARSELLLQVSHAAFGANSDAGSTDTPSASAAVRLSVGSR